MGGIIVQKSVCRGSVFGNDILFRSTASDSSIADRHAIKRLAFERQFTYRKCQQIKTTTSATTTRHGRQNAASVPRISPPSVRTVTSIDLPQYSFLFFSIRKLSVRIRSVVRLSTRTPAISRIRSGIVSRLPATLRLLSFRA
jgi:hypothetical protein